MTALATTNETGISIAEQAAVMGDLSGMNPQQRMAYYGEVCRSLGLNPLTRPFEFIVLNDKLTLYARRDATDQLRKIHNIAIQIVSREVVDDVYVIVARATTPDGRSDESTGAVPLVKESGTWKTAQSGKKYLDKDGSVVPLGPDDRANAMMKAETKAKRRVTLSIVGLGWLDESELETIKGAHPAPVEPAPIRQIADKPQETAVTRARINRELREAETKFYNLHGKTIAAAVGTTPALLKWEHVQQYMGWVDEPWVPGSVDDWTWMTTQIGTAQPVTAAAVEVEADPENDVPADL